MNVEEKLQEKLNSPDFLCIHGSQMYGTSGPNSDIDIRGFIIPPPDYIFGMYDFESSKSVIPSCINGLFPDKKIDIYIYSIKKFLKNIAHGSTQDIETLFVPKYNFICSTPAFHEDILNRRQYLISPSSLFRMSSYSISEIFRSMNDIRWITNGFNIIEFLAKKYDYKFPEYDQYYSVLGKKNIINSVRLLLEIRQLCEKGEIVFPFCNDDLNLLNQIKENKFKVSEILIMFRDMYLKIDKMILQRSHLFNKTSDVYNEVNNLLKKIYSIRFNSFFINQ